MSTLSAAQLWTTLMNLFSTSVLPKLPSSYLDLLRQNIKTGHIASNEDSAHVHLLMEPHSSTVVTVRSYGHKQIHRMPTRLLYLWGLATQAVALAQ